MLRSPARKRTARYRTVAISDTDAVLELAHLVADLPDSHFVKKKRRGNRGRACRSDPKTVCSTATGFK